MHKTSSTPTLKICQIIATNGVKALKTFYCRASRKSSVKVKIFSILKNLTNYVTCNFVSHNEMFCIGQKICLSNISYMHTRPLNVMGISNR